MAGLGFSHHEGVVPFRDIGIKPGLLSQLPQASDLPAFARIIGRPKPGSCLPTTHLGRVFESFSQQHDDGCVHIVNRPAQSFDGMNRFGRLRMFLCFGGIDGGIAPTALLVIAHTRQPSASYRHSPPTGSVIRWYAAIQNRRGTLRTTAVRYASVAVRSINCR